MISARVVPSFTISISLALSRAFLLGIVSAPFPLGLVSIHLETNGDYQKNEDKIRKTISIFNELIYVDSPSRAEWPHET